MAEALDPSGAPVTVGRVTLRTPGLAGVAEEKDAGPSGMRGEEDTTNALREAFASQGLQDTDTIEVAETEEQPTAAATGTRSTTQGEPAIELDVPEPNQGWGQFVLASDEASVMTWNFATGLPTAPPADVSRGADTRTYVIRRTVVPTPGATDDKTRGVLTGLGKKLFKVVAFKLIDPIIGEVADHFVGKWEKNHRPYRVRTFTPNDYKSPDPAKFTGGDWQRMGQGRALLMIHGTFSRAHSAFGSMPKSVVEQLHGIYGGRVFAFDHFTMSQTPKENIEWFLSRMPADQSLDIDIVCHSRGGLVSRVLENELPALNSGGREVRIGRIVFAAAPNAGTTLADPRYMGDFVDTYTNVLNFLPDTGVLEVLEAIIAVVKQLAVGALGGLDGLQSMNPKGKFLRDLNQGPKGGTRYFALASNYEPTDAGLKQFAADRLVDRIFAKKENDLVVPTHGVYEANDHGSFPIGDPHIFDETFGVGHTAFFGRPEVHQKLVQWLQ